jgi:hypothetical protein
LNYLRPFVRKLISKFDFEALDVKMSKAKVSNGLECWIFGEFLRFIYIKGLFYLMAERSSSFTPYGYVTVRSMAVELAAGGISPENVNYVRKVGFFF